ncbi:MAG TPA: Ig-like domain repeat protein, partial [Edaphobacter sp.]|nr:Ig-like domain repeat protein [Edaphobacter sp.]
MDLTKPPVHNCRVSTVVAALWLLLWVSTAAVAQQSAISAPVLLPAAVAFDASGNLYIAEMGNHRIRKVDPLGNISTVVGTGVQGYGGDGGSAASALLDSPQGLAVYGGNLYVADTHNHRVRRVDLNAGSISTIAAHLDRPAALAVDLQGDLFIADEGSHQILRIDAGTGGISTVAGAGIQGYGGDKGSAIAALLDSPTGIAVDAVGNIYVADSHNQRVRRIDASTGVITSFAGTGAQGFSGDAGPAVHAALALPRGVSLDSQGNIVVVDSGNNRVRRIDLTTGAITTTAGDGIQGFAGDGGAALSASVDSPREAAVSPTGDLTFTDGANQRVRIVSGWDIQTIAGLGTLSRATVELSGTEETVYGSGSLIATVRSSTAADGVVRLMDGDTGNSVIGQQAVTQGAELFDLSKLSAGKHTLIAHYSGDLTHSIAQSEAFLLTVKPRPLTAIISPSSFSYGEALPSSLAGSLTGVLPADQADLFAAYSLNVTPRPDAGEYPVTVTLSGSAAGNYTVPAAPTLTVTRASTTTTLTATTASLVSASSADAGQPVLMKVHVAPAASGNPGGTLILSEGGTLLAAGPPDTSGDLSFVVSSLAIGPHSLSASYSGDHNFQPSRSPTMLFVVNSPPSGPVDFTLAPSSATTQTVNSGDSANFALVVNTKGDLSAPVTLAASGLPNLATASFNPGSVVPGSPSTTVTMTISTPRTTASLTSRSPVWLALLFVGIFPLTAGRRMSVRLLVLLLATFLPLAAGCGDRVNAGTAVPGTTKSYAITVMGT